jgi:hypothetical protein
MEMMAGVPPSKGGLQAIRAGREPVPEGLAALLDKAELVALVAAMVALAVQAATVVIALMVYFLALPR